MQETSAFQTGDDTESSICIYNVEDLFEYNISFLQ